jgi:diguanylate cyclase (GGDEF)-like protein
MKFLLFMYKSLGESLGIHSHEQLFELFTSTQHGPPISRHRAAVIQSRIYFFSVIFAILVPTWSVIDALFLPDGLWRELLLIRLVSAAIFVFVAWQSRQEPGIKRARFLLAGMLAVTPLFHLASAHLIHAYPLAGIAQVIAELYGLLPFVIVAGLTLFPLTLVEFIAYAVPMFLVTLFSVQFSPASEVPHAVATLWLFALLLGVAMFSALNQLRYMLSQVSRASYDALTGALTRRAGIDVLDLQFRLAAMSGASLSLLFFDLDNFKSINDTFGHDAGDRILKTATQQLGKLVRKGDSVIRWGGEEFVVVLPTADSGEANEVVSRIMLGGLGDRPDGQPVTASIGVSEAQEDAPGDWKRQVALADQRMYTAKTGGRARSIGVHGEALLWCQVAVS